MAQAGAPTKYESRFDNMLIEHMAAGYSYESFAGIARVSRMSLFNWEKDFPSWVEAKEIAWSLNLLFWEKQSIEGLYDQKTFDPHTGATTQKKLNTGVFCMNMKARHGWKDRVEVTGDAKAPVQARLVIDWSDVQVAPIEEKKAA